MTDKFLIIAVVAIILVAAVGGAAVLLTNQGESDEVKKRAHFEIVSFTLSDQIVVTGQPLSASVSMKNDGAADGDHELGLFLDGVLVNSTVISLGVGNSTTVELGFVCHTAGNQSVRVENNTATFNCLERYVVGDLMKWHITGYDPERFHDVDAYWSTEVVSANSTSFSVRENYDGLPFDNGTYEYSYAELADDFDNLTLIGTEAVETAWGIKTLSHYNHSYYNGPHLYMYDLYIDEATMTQFRISTSVETPEGEKVLLFELVETNIAWVAGI